MSFIVLGDDWTTSKTKMYQTCRNTCEKDAQNLGKIGYFSSKKKCDCFCKKSLKNVTTKELIFYRQNNFFTKSFEIKRQKYFRKCFK